MRKTVDHGGTEGCVEIDRGAKTAGGRAIPAQCRVKFPLRCSGGGLYASQVTKTVRSVVCCFNDSGEAFELMSPC
jgi:hypothetical protein